MKSKLIFITGEYGQIAKTMRRILTNSTEYSVTFVNDICRFMSSVPPRWYDRRQSHLAHMYEHDPEYSRELDVTCADTMNMCVKMLVDRASEFDAIEIWHTAAHVGADKCALNYDATFNVNVMSVVNLIAAVNIYRFFDVHPLATFVNFTSTSLLRPQYHKMYQKLGVDDAMNGLTGLFDESTPRQPQAWYGHTKLMAENLFKSAFQGNNRCFNVAPVMGCGVFPDDNASDMRKYASVVKRYLEGDIMSHPPMVCNQNFEFFKAYVDIEVVMREMIDYVTKTVEHNVPLDVVLNHQVHEAVFAGTKVQRFSDILYDICLEMISQFYYKKSFDEIDEEMIKKEIFDSVEIVQREIARGDVMFINKKENDYLGCHLPEFNFILHLANVKNNNNVLYDRETLTQMNPNILRWQPKLVEIHNTEPEHIELVKKLVKSHF